MLGAGVDLQLAELLATEPRLRDHSPDCTPDYLFGIVCEKISVGTLRQTSGVAAVVVGELSAGLVGGHDRLGGVNDNNEVTGVDVGGEDRLVLTAQTSGHLGGHPAEHHAVGVDD